MDDAMMSMLLASGGGTNNTGSSLENAMMKMFLGTMGNAIGFDYGSPGMCTEGDWEDHPMGELFRAARDRQIFEVEALLERDKYKQGVNELDGDGGGVLHILALQGKLPGDDAEAMVNALKNAGADLDLRSGKMLSSETPLHVAAW